MGTDKQVILFFCMHERNFLNCFYFFTVSKLLAYSKSLSELILCITFFHMCVDVHLCVGARVCIHVEARSCFHLTCIGAQSHPWFCQLTYSGSPACCRDPPPYTENIGRSLNSSGIYRNVMEPISWPPACIARALLPLSHHPAQHFLLKNKMNKAIFLNNKIIEIRNSILFTVQCKTSSHCL